MLDKLGKGAYGDVYRGMVCRPHHIVRLTTAADRSAASFRDKENISEPLRVEVSLPIELLRLYTLFLINGWSLLYLVESLG
jgi:hypothetical protein